MTAETAYARWARRDGAKRRGGLRLLLTDHGVEREISDPYLEALGWKYISTKELPRAKAFICAPTSCRPGD
jgi:hypothetical protein